MVNRIKQSERDASESARNVYLQGKVCRVAATGSNLSGFFSNCSNKHEREMWSSAFRLG